MLMVMNSTQVQKMKVTRDVTLKNEGMCVLCVCIYVHFHHVDLYISSGLSFIFFNQKYKTYSK